MAGLPDDKAASAPDERVRKLSEERQRLYAELLKQAQAAKGTEGAQVAQPPASQPPAAEAPSSGEQSAASPGEGGAPGSARKEEQGVPPHAGAEPPWNELLQQWAMACQAAALSAQQAMQASWAQAMPFPGTAPGATGAPFPGGFPGAAPGPAGAPSGSTPWVANEFWRHAAEAASAGAPPPSARQPAAEALITLKKSGSLPPLFLVAPIFGSAFPYHLLALHLDPEQPVYGLQSPALAGSSEPHESIPAMARDYIAIIKRVQRNGPYYLGGYSFGGWTAFEIARQLMENGESVAFLGVLGAGVPPSMSAPAYAKAMDYAWELLDNQIRLSRDTSLSDQQRVAQKAAEASSGTPLQRVAAANTRASLRYVPRPLEGGLSLFVTSDVLASSPNESTLGWWMLCTRDVDIHIHEGNHLNCFSEPHVRDLARKIDARLKTARERARRG